MRRERNKRTMIGNLSNARRRNSDFWRAEAKRRRSLERKGLAAEEMDDKRRKNLLCLF